MEHARPLEAVVTPDESPLAHARLHRQLTVDEAARRASVTPEEISWLEEGRLYRFATPDRAITVVLLYATALGLDHREALDLAGLEVPPLPPSRRRRLVATAVFFAVLLAAALAVVLAQSTGSPAKTATSASSLPAPWQVKVDVLNGSGDIVFTRSIASRIQSMSYRVTHVGKASSFTYPQTQVFYPPGGEPVCTELAKQLDVPVQPLPGGSDPLRCVVIVGPQRGPTQ